jgi:hypothetical protein
LGLWGLPHRQAHAGLSRPQPEETAVAFFYHFDVYGVTLDA